MWLHVGVASNGPSIQWFYFIFRWWYWKLNIQISLTNRLNMGLNKTESFGNLHFKLAPTQQNIIQADRKIWRCPRIFLMEHWSLKMGNLLFDPSNLFKGTIPGLFLIYLGLSIKQYNFNSKFMFPSSIQWYDSNPWPYDHESTPVSIRPGLRSNFVRI